VGTKIGNMPISFKPTIPPRHFQLMDLELFEIEAWLFGRYLYALTIMLKTVQDATAADFR
jgi:hypothetical protein